jgi:phage terminase large subunit
MKSLDIPRNAPIFADASQPSAIESIRRAGFYNIEKSYKGPDSVQTGIDRIKSFEVYASPLSKNLQYEYEMYSWRTGTNKPIDKHNHLMDAIRYTLAGKQEGPQYATMGRLRKNQMSF